MPALKQIFIISIVLEFLAASENFDYPIVLAAPGRFYTLPTLIDDYATQVIPPNYGAAAARSRIIFAILSLSTFTVYLFVTRKTFMFQSIRGNVSRQTVHLLRGVGRWFAFGYCFVVFSMQSRAAIGCHPVVSVHTPWQSLCFLWLEEFL